MLSLLELRCPSSPAFRHGQAWFSGLWTWAGIMHHRLLGFSGLGLSWNNTSCFSGSPACRQQIMGLLSLLNCMSQSLIINLPPSLSCWFHFSGELWLHGWEVVVTESQLLTTRFSLTGFRADPDLAAWRHGRSRRFVSHDGDLPRGRLLCNHLELCCPKWWLRAGGRQGLVILKAAEGRQREGFLESDCLSLSLTL